MEAAGTSKMSVTIYQSTRCHAHFETFCVYRKDQSVQAAKGNILISVE
jgi:hypothetical protein